MKKYPVFAALRFDGSSRFQDGLMPLEALHELEAYRDLIVEVAKDLYFQQNPRRQNLPKHFEKRIQLRLGEIRDGSVEPIIERAPGHDQRGQQKAPFFDGADYAVLGRDLVTSVVEEAGNGRALPKDFPDHLIELFRNFGGSLVDQEIVELRRTEDRRERPAVYDREVRERILRSAAAPVESDISITGSVFSLDSEKFEARLRLGNGQAVRVELQPYHVERVAKALPGRLQAFVVGRGYYTAEHVLKRIAQVNRLEVLEPPRPPPMADRLSELATLKDGWLGDGAGRALDQVGLAWVRGILDSAVRNDVPQPFLFPTEDGNVTAEWSAGEWEIRAEFNLPARSIEMMAVNTGTSAVFDEVVESDDPDAAEKLAVFVLARAQTGEEE